MQYTATIEPNEKYRAVINGETDYTYKDEQEYRDKHPAPGAADAYLEMIDSAAEPDPEHVRVEPLSWSMTNVASDPDVVKKMATYFDGMDTDEPTDLLRAKLRLVEIDVYVNAQIAAQAELRDGV